MLLLAAILGTASTADNEQRTLDLVHALGQGRLRIDAELVDARGHANTVDRAFADGHYYSGGAPGLAFALLPAQIVLRSLLGGAALVWALGVVGAALPLALSALAVRRALAARGADDATARLGACAHAFGTIALAFGTCLYAHALVIALVAWSLALALERKRLALAGALVAFAVVCDYNVGVVALALLAFVAAREGVRGALAFGLGALGPAAVLAAYHTACFGRPWRTPYDFHAEAATREIVKSAYGFSWPRPSIVLELLLGTRRGALFTQPVVLAGAVGLGALAARKDRGAAFALGVAAAVLLLHASRARDWHAGASFGARYSAAALPFVALGYPRAFALAGRGRLPLVLASLALALVGATAHWGFDVFTSWEMIRVFGPRAAAPGALIGLEEHGRAAALVGVGALAAALSATLALVARVRPAALAAAAVAPLLVAAPAFTLVLTKGPDAVRAEHGRLARAQVFRKIASVDDVAEARMLAGFCEHTGDAELTAAARARVAALEGRR